MHNGLFSPISFLNISDYRLQARLCMGWWKDVSNCLYWLHISGSRIMNMLPFSLWHYCLIDITHMRLPCALSHTLDLFHNLFVYISILQLVPFKFVGFFFCTLQRKIICVLPISYWTALMRHKFSKWPYAEPKYTAISLLLFLLPLGRCLCLVDC